MIASRRFLAVVTIAVGATVGAFAAASAAPMSSMGAYSSSAGQASVATPVSWVCYYSGGYRYCKWCWYSYGRRYCKAPVRRGYRKYRRRRYYY